MPENIPENRSPTNVRVKLGFMPRTAEGPIIMVAAPHRMQPTIRVVHHVKNIKTLGPTKALRKKPIPKAENTNPRSPSLMLNCDER